MIKYVLDVDVSKCNGCLECVYACSQARFGVIDVSRSCIRVITERAIVINVSVCRHCRPAPCVEVCEFGALKYDDSIGRVVLDPELCNNCKACLAVCPFNAIVDVGESMIKCDLCDGNPKCVSACKRGAIKYIPAIVSRRSRGIPEVLSHIHEYLRREVGV